MNSPKLQKNESRTMSALCITIMFTAIFFCSCANQSSSNFTSSSVSEQLIPIDLKRNDQVSVYDLFSKIEIIPLETTSQSLLSFPIGEPDRVIVNEGKYYFMDRELQCIIIFDSDGKFLKKIDRKGMGPEEYPSIDDFNINRFSRNIEILSSRGQCVYVYDPSGDTFIEKISLSKDIPVAHFFHHLTPDIYVFISQSVSFDMFLYSKESNKIIQKCYSLPKWMQSTVFTSSKNPFYVYNDTLCFEQMYNGDVFTLSPDNYNLMPRYDWDFGQHNLELSIFPENESMNYYLDLSRRISMDYAVLFLIYKENSKYYMTRFKFENRYRHLVYDKKTNQYLIFEKFKEGGQCLPSWIDEEAIYTMVAPFYRHLVINSSFLDEKNKLKYSQIKEDDNPVVIKYTFK